MGVLKRGRMKALSAFTLLPLLCSHSLAKRPTVIKLPPEFSAVPQVGHLGGVNSVSFSPDGRLLASGSRDGTICLWDVRKGKCLRVLKGHEALVWSVSFSPDGRLLASGGHYGSIRLWDVKEKEESFCLWEFEDGSYIVQYPDRRLKISEGAEDKVVFTKLGTLEGLVWRNFFPKGQKFW